MAAKQVIVCLLQGGTFRQAGVVHQAPRGWTDFCQPLACAGIRNILDHDLYACRTPKGCFERRLITRNRHYSERGISQ
ncbi:MAG: hypothetical protein BroJett014_11620 [Planctomycetota bacterium]|nr:MAG: hypothetical protein BroJett014_11620 [Planctomycetota bacterium]